MNKENFLGNINLNKIKKYALSRFKIQSSLHGLSHWERVFENGLILAEADSRVNKKIVALFAYLHDCERENDNSDSLHGVRAADELHNISYYLLEYLSEEEFELLYKAIFYHDSGKTTKNPTIGACFDADRLDLTRCGITLNPDYMSTQKGKEIAINGGFED